MHIGPAMVEDPWVVDRGDARSSNGAAVIGDDTKDGAGENGIKTYKLWVGLAF
jgi:hypothetical protein